MRSRGWVKGEPMRFRRGHGTRGKTTDHGHAVESRGYSTPCWIWNGPVLASGYGWWSRQYAHRRAYENARGAIPQGLHIDHLCDVRLCVNPDHLEAVTQAENNRRVWARGRRRRSAQDLPQPID